MLQGLRDFLNRTPWLGWALAGLLLAAAVFLVVRGGRSSNPYAYDELAETVVLVCRETGEEFTLPRGRVEMELWGRPLPIDPEQGLANPKTGRPTLFPKSEWEATIERISADRLAVKDSRRRGAKARPGAD